MPLVDSSVVVRYLTMDPPDQAARAQALIDSGEDLSISTVAMAEIAYVLTRVYGVARDATVDLLVQLLGRNNLSVIGLPKTAVVDALLLCRDSGRVSFADALIWAEARSAGAGIVYTFDQRFPDMGIDRRML